MDLDTIAAIATPLGEGGIAVIRVSGSGSIAAVDRVFQSKLPLADVDTHTIHYGHIVDPKHHTKIEEVLVTVMRAPRSFTTEDVVEISCHGGLISVKKVLELVLEQQVRLAEPGEFTKRAFLNGRIDLSQAEAVIDLIRSKSDRAFQVALKQADGTLSRHIQSLRHTLVETMAHIEVNIDYPEHDVEHLTSAFIRDRCQHVLDEVERLLKLSGEGKILREGITTAIIGRPNVGKSSLMNELTQENKAIVTDIPGTTRDVIEEYVNVNGIPLRLLDTAGIRETSDIVEQIGVERSKNALSQADLILLVLNYNETISEEDTMLLAEIQGRQSIVIVNKMDLPQALDLEQLYTFVPSHRVVKMSLKEDQGLQQLGELIASMFFSGDLESSDLTYVSNVRHISLLNRAKHALEESISAVDLHVPIDMIQIDIRTAWEHLGEIIGDAAPDSLIDQIFSQFCLGK